MSAYTGEPGKSLSKEEKALREMIHKARDLGLDQGVAFVLVWGSGCYYPQITFRILKLESHPDLNKKGDTGVNHFGVVMGMLAVMLSTNSDSGLPQRPLKLGESPYEGGILTEYKERTLFVGFDGGTQNQNSIVSFVGTSSLLSS
jgi:hypothetical protein